MTSSDLHSFADIGIGRREYAPCSRALSPSRLPGLDLALNPYRGCSHACVYCYAPALLHAPVAEWSSPLPKRDFLRLLAKELRSACGVIGIGTSTDPYQPLEAEERLTRGSLELLNRHGLKACVHTKSDLVLRDIDLLSEHEVCVTVTSLDLRLSRAFEPGAPSPQRRLAALSGLVQADVHASAMVGPALSCIEGNEMELASAIAETGVRSVMVDPLNVRPDRRDELASAGLRPASASSIMALKESFQRLDVVCRDAF